MRTLRGVVKACWSGPDLERKTHRRVAAGVLASVLVAAAPAVAEPLDRVTGSWNMQGETDMNLESRWTDDIPAAIRDHGVEVLALQEAGNRPPPGSDLQTDRFRPSQPDDPSEPRPPPGVTEWLWNYGNHDRPVLRHIYWGNTEQQRNGLAIVSAERARDVILLNVDGEFAEYSRPMLGVRIGNDWYFNAHALSNGPRSPNDAPDIIEAARAFMRTRPGSEQWVVLADFNREPARMPVSMQRYLVASDHPTHQSGSVLDFMFSSMRNRNQNTVQVDRTGIISDHYMVRYALNQGCNPRQRRAAARSTATAAARDCDAPLPGETYRFFPRHLNDAVLADEESESGPRPTVKKPTGAETEAVQVRFSSTPGRYLLAFDDDWCLTRNRDPESGNVTPIPCDPDLDTSQWELRQGQIVAPGQSGALQPSPNRLGAQVRVTTGLYQWRHEPFAPPNKPPNHGELRKRDLTVMPLGDSITEGVGSSTGSSYRAKLFGDLEANAKSVDFVGSQRSGQLSDPDHEGHSGWTIAQIAQAADAAVPANRPNVVVLHAGTNDMDRGQQNGAVGRLDGLIAQIQEDSSGTTVLVATLVPSTNRATQDRITAFNREIRDLVRRRQSAGERVALVDMSAVTTADLADGLHPNDAGYRKMADAFFKAVADAAERGWIQAPSGGTRPGCPAPGGRWIPRGQIASGTGAATGPRVRFADLDGDGKDDYLVVGLKGEIDAWRNTGGDQNGRSGWVPMGRIATGTGLQGTVVLADIDADDKADYLVIGSKGEVNAWRNTGGDKDGRSGWVSLGQIAAGVGSQGSANVVFADINGDRRADYLTVSRTNAVSAWVNIGGDKDGRAGWLPRGQIASGVGTPNDQVVFADVTCDRNADYLLLDPAGQLSAWRNNGGDKDGRPGWVSMGRIAAGVGAAGAIQLADIDGDGLDDYLVVGENGSVQAWKNNGGDPP